jgi:branched-chain amino acid transport system permease protein
LSFHRSAEVLLVLVLGGTGHLYGALIGAVVFMGLHDVLSNLTTQYWQFWLGAMFVLLVLFARNGIMGLLAALGRRVRRGAAP